MEPLDLSNVFYGIHAHLGVHTSERSAQSNLEPATAPEDRVSISAGVYHSDTTTAFSSAAAVQVVNGSAAPSGTSSVVRTPFTLATALQFY